MTIMENLYDQELNTERMFRQKEILTLQEGYRGMAVRVYRNLGYTKSEVVEAVMKKFSVSHQEAAVIVKRYWNYKLKRFR